MNEASPILAQEIRRLEEERCEAMLSQDVAVLEQLLDDELAYTHSSGVVDTKGSYITGVKEKLWHYQSIDRRDELLLLRDNHALVFNRTLMDIDIAGVPRKLDNNTLAVWSRSVDNQWRFIALHSSPRPVRT